MKRFLLFVFALLATQFAFSQARNASVTGLVADPSGARVPNARVTAANTQTNISHEATTDSHGEYNLVELPPGNYKIAVTSNGFQQEQRVDVVLDVAQSARIDFVLKVGESQTVNVDAAPPLLESQSSEISNVIDNRKVNDLPLNGRQFYSLALLSPAALPPAQTSTNGFRGGFNVAGQPEVANNFFVNGIIDVDEIANYPAFRPSVETIQEFKLQTGTYPAEYGLRNGGQVEIVTKSGGNQFHGDLFEFLRNQATDAKAYFNNSGKASPLKQNQFGGTIGGPIWKDHTFFFFGYEGIRLRQGVGAVRTTVPTGDIDTYNMRNGDFRQLLTLPTAKQIHVYIPGTKTDFSTPNVIDPIYKSALGQQLLNWAFPQPLYATAAGAQPSNNYFNQDVSREGGNEGSLRIDHKIGNKDQLFLNYNLFNDPTYLAYSGQCGSSVLPGFGCDQTTVSQLGAFGETHTFGSSLVNEFRIGYNRYHQKRSVDPSQFLLRNALNSNGLVPSAGGAALTLALSTSSWGTTAFGMVPNNRFDTAKQVSDSITWLFRAHTFKAGYTLISNVAVYVHDIQGAGTLTFVPGSGPTANTTGYDIADLLTGTVDTSSYSPLSIAATTHPTITSHLFYVQDDWKVSPYLTLNYGLRYELTTPMHENDGFGSVFDPTLAASATTVAGAFRVTNGRNGNSKYPYHMDKNNFAPRFGLAWRPLKNDSTVVRAGYGVYFYSTPTLTTGLSGWERQTPFTAAATGYTSSLANPLTLSSGVHPTANPFNPAAISSSTTTLPTGFGFDPRFATPYINQYSLGVQQALTRRLSLDVGYLGSTGDKLLNVLDYNQPLPSTTNGYAAANATRPLPTWGKISWAQSGLKASYNALLVKLQQNYGNGLSFTAAYTYAKAIDNGAGIISTGDSSSATPQDSRNLGAEKGPSDFDIKHRFVVSPVYDLPFGKGKQYLNHGIAAPIVGGWRLSGIFSVQTGTPFTITNGSTNVDNSTGTPVTCTTASNINCVAENNQSHTFEAGSTTSNDRPNWVSNPNAHAPHTAAQWFNPAAFALNTPGTFGTERRNAVRGPHYTNLDLAIARDFPVYRETLFQFRVEAFNIANHPNFYNPAGTATKYDPTNLGAFGSISNTYAPRQLQFALKYVF